MNAPRAEQLFAAKNLTSEVMLDTFNVGAISEPIDLRVDLLLGRTGGLVYGRGSTYSLQAEIVRTVGGNSETFRLPRADFVVSGTAAASRMAGLVVRVHPQDVLRIYASSSAAGDTSVSGAAWYYDAGSTVLTPSGVAGLLAANVDSTGAAAVSLKKAIEAMLAVLAGAAVYDAATGVESFHGRDGSTVIVSNTLTGAGQRTASTIY